MTYFPHTPNDRRKMLERIGVGRFEDLLRELPPELVLQKPLALPKRLSELETAAHLRSLAGENGSSQEYVSFLGGGIYDHYVPAAVDAILRRPEFYTAYTPYQAEVAQGTLQAIYEFQSLICQLTGMEVSNASMYDGPSAVAEAALLATGQTGRKEILFPATLNPHYQKVLATYSRGGAMKLAMVRGAEGTIDLEDLKKKITDRTAAVIVQQPNFYGCLEKPAEFEPLVHQAGALLIAVCDPISLGLLAPPGEYNSDLAVGEGQSLGIPTQLGGPGFGFFAGKKELVRRMPGRIAAETVDAKGRRGYVLTLQTREQHIRREKATSNICTNQALCALAAAVYLSLLGRAGIKDIAELCLQKAHYAVDQLARLPGFRLRFASPFFKEFVLETPVPARKIIRAALKKGIFAGVDLGQYQRELKNCLLIAVTEKRTRAEIERLVDLLAKVTQARQTSIPGPERQSAPQKVTV